VKRGHDGLIPARLMEKLGQSAWLQRKQLPSGVKPTASEPVTRELRAPAPKENAPGWLAPLRSVQQ